MSRSREVWSPIARMKWCEDVSMYSQECQPFNPYPRVVPQHGKLSEENTLEKWLEGSPWATSCRLGQVGNTSAKPLRDQQSWHKVSISLGRNTQGKCLRVNRGATNYVRKSNVKGKNDHSRGLVTINCPQSSQHIILTPLHQIIAIIIKEANYPSTSPKMAGTSADFGDRLPRYPQGVSSQIGSNNTAKHLVSPAPVGPPSSYELNTW